MQLQWIAHSGAQTGASAHPLAERASQKRLAWLLAGLLLLVVVGGGSAWLVRAHQKAPAMYFNSPVAFAANDVALSPDGRTVALVAYSDQANKYVL